MTNNGTEIEPVYVFENGKIDEPGKLEKPFAKFIEWQKDGKAYDFASPVTANMTLTALWNDYAPEPQDLTLDTTEVEITLTVNPRPATINHAPQLEIVDKTITAGDELDLKSLITKASDKEDGDNLTDQVVITSGTFNNKKAGEYKIIFALTDSEGAKITKTATVTVKPKTYIITYNLAGGTLNGQTEAVKIIAEENEKIILPKPTRKGYTLDYWQGSRYQPGDTYVVTEDHTFTAIWKAVEVSSTPNASGKPSETTKSTANQKAPQTGENNNAIVYSLLLIAGASLMIALRKKEYEVK